MSSVEEPNLWFSQLGTELTEKYLETSTYDASTITSVVSARNIVDFGNLSKPAKVLDVGVGVGRLALLLTHEGHEVVGLEPDDLLFRFATESLSTYNKNITPTILPLSLDEYERVRTSGADFDLVCCHSVLMYVENASDFLATAVRLVKPGGMLSISSINPDAIAMRAGLVGEWSEAEQLMQDDIQVGPLARLYCHSPDKIMQVLNGLGMNVEHVLGIGIFSDHLCDAKIEREKWADLLACEITASRRAPYKNVGRLFQLIAKKALAS